MYSGSEEKWLAKRAGKFSASELHNLMSKDGSFTQGNKSYLYRLERERNLGRPRPQKCAKPLDFGKENEKFCIEYIKENTDWCVIPVSDFDFAKEMTFVMPNDFMGATPDAFRLLDKIGEGGTYSWDWLVHCAKKEIIECKCVYGELAECKLFSTSLPYERKKKIVESDHIDQIIGQFLCFSDVDTIHLVKYLPQDDDDFDDILSPTHPSRGIFFTFERKDYQERLEFTMKRLTFAEEYLASRKCLDDINEAWNSLTKKEKEDESKDSKLEAQ